MVRSEASLRDATLLVFQEHVLENATEMIMVYYKNALTIERVVHYDTIAKNDNLRSTYIYVFEPNRVGT